MDSTDATSSTFEDLYHACMRQVYGFIFARVQHQETAEDLTSETFFKAQRSWPPRAAAETGRKAWLFEIARNVVRDHARAEERRPVRSLEQEGASRLVVAGPALDEQV